MRAEWEERNVWDNLRGRKGTDGMWERWEIEVVGMAEEALNGEKDEGLERRGPGQGPGLGPGERKTSPPVGARVRRT